MPGRPDYESNSRTQRSVPPEVLVGEDQAEPSAGLIAWTAPLARALKGAKAGETVDLEAGGRVDPITVVAIAMGGVPE
jgi:transcription elongation GreA/GreB family factor